MRTKSILFTTLMMSVLFLGACQKSTADIDKSVAVVPPSIVVGVVPFTQPRTVSELITGYIPERQGVIAKDTMRTLDGMLRSSLYTENRTYTWLPAPLALHSADYHESASPQALDQWLAYGREYRVDFLLVPQILTWHQRVGSRAGVKTAAHVRAEFFLLDIKGNRIFRRSVFEEQQTGVANNVLGAGKMFRRGGWITAEELTQEAITQAADELGFQ